MYQALGIKKLIGTLAAIGCLILLGLIWYMPPDSFAGWIGHLSTSATGTALLVAIVGHRIPFCFLWRLKPIQNFIFPYIAGEWVGTISSNWPAMKAMMTAFSEGGGENALNELHIDNVGTTKKIIRVYIDADFFQITMRLDTDDNYSASYSIVVKPDKKGTLGHPRLYYMYRNETRSPEPTDSEDHWGAGYLEVRCEKKALHLKGIYWTARNWTRGLNTAGKIVLQKNKTTDI